VVPAIVSILLLLPLAFRAGWEPRLLGLPHVWSGDEPSYLVIISSLVQDGDLDLANNYASVHHGHLDAGRNFAGNKALDHHTSLRWDDKRVFWCHVYDNSVPKEKWPVSASGERRPPVRPGQPAPPAGTPEYSTHQPGIAFLLAPLVWPLRGTHYLECACLLCSGLATVGAFFFLRLLLHGYSSDGWTIDVISAAGFLGTPAWFYGRSLFMESFLLFFLAAAYALALRRNAAFWPGVCLAVAIQLKAYVVLMALPLAADWLLRRDARRLLLFAVPVALGVAGFLVTNKVCNGGFFIPPQPFVFGSFREGAFGLLLSPRWGALYFAPVCIFAALCWPAFLWSYPREALILGALVVINFVLFANWCCPSGGACYGPRFLAPVLPFFCVAMVAAGARFFRARSPARSLVFALMLASAAINAGAVFPYSAHWGENLLAQHIHDRYERDR
jgi:hypothetical protein